MKGFRLILGALLVWLGGCGGGETVPLVAPSGNCDQGVDPRWQLQGGFFSGVSLEAVYWPDGGRPVVVGRDGFVAENEAPGRWHREDPGIWTHLNRVAGDGEGGLLVVGNNGGALRRPDGQWLPLSGLPSGGWNDLEYGAGAYWLAGSEGLLVRVDGNAQIQVVPVPTDGSLRAVLAEPDSLFVAGRNGFCQVRVGAEWTPLDAPVSAEDTVREIIRLDDGRLLLDSDLVGSMIYVREADGWVQHPEINPGGYSGQIRFEDGYLWVGDDGWQRWDVSGDSWTVQEYPGATGGDVSFGPEGQVFWLGYRDMGWFQEESPGEVTWERDSALAPSFGRLFRLQDGSVVAPGQGKIHLIEAGGSREILSLPEVTWSSRLTGSSLRDFYILNSGLLHVVDGQGAQEIPLPEGLTGWRAVAANATGQIMLCTYDDLGVWDGSRWHILNDFDPYDSGILATRYQTLVAFDYRAAVYMDDEGLIQILLPWQVVAVCEPEPGRLMFLSREGRRCFYSKGTGLVQELGGELLPVCEDFYVRSFLETEGGGVLLTSMPNLVLDIRISGEWVEWDLVAGPWRNQIQYLQVLADGSLAALDTDSGELLIHPAPGN